MSINLISGMCTVLNMRRGESSLVGMITVAHNPGTGPMVAGITDITLTFRTSTLLLSPTFLNDRMAHGGRTILRRGAHHRGI